MDIKPTSNLIQIANELNTNKEQPVYAQQISEHIDTLKPESNNIVDLYI